MTDERYVTPPKKKAPWAPKGAKIGPSYRPAVFALDFESSSVTESDSDSRFYSDSDTAELPSTHRQTLIGEDADIYSDSDTEQCRQNNINKESAAGGRKRGRESQMGVESDVSGSCGRGSQFGVESDVSGSYVSGIPHKKACVTPPPTEHSGYTKNNPEGQCRQNNVKKGAKKRGRGKKKRGRGSQLGVESDVSGSYVSGIPHKKACVTPPPIEHSSTTRRAGGSDAGGCMVVALNKCCAGVLTAGELDVQIEKVHEEQNKQLEWAPNKYKREWCGIPGVTWHQDCIAKALKQKYPPSSGGYTWCKQPADSIYEPGQGKVYVHGLLNSALWPDMNQSSCWQHAICVNTDTGRFCDGNSNSWRSVAKWLQCREEDRYMVKVWRVYKLVLGGKKL
jgi:hypothetical protein